MKKRNLILAVSAFVLVGGLTCGAYFLGSQSVAEPVLPAETTPTVSAPQLSVQPDKTEPEATPVPAPTPESAPAINVEAMFPAEIAAPPKVQKEPPQSPPAPPIRATSLSAVPSGPQDVPDGVISFDAGYAGSGTPVRPDPPASGTAGMVSEAEDGSDWQADDGDASDSFDYDLESFAAEVLRLTNEARAEAGAGPLETDPVLSEMAQARMDESGGKMTHIRPDGTTPETIFAEYDTALTCTGEILISACRSPQAVVDGFLSSPTHRRNMLNPDHQYAGIGVVWGETHAGPGIAVLELFAK